MTEKKDISSQGDPEAPNGTEGTSKAVENSEAIDPADEGSGALSQAKDNSETIVQAEEHSEASLQTDEEVSDAAVVDVIVNKEGDAASADTVIDNGQKRPRKKTGVAGFLSNLVTVLLVILIIVLLFLNLTRDGNGVSVFGYSMFNVLTGSMNQNEEHKGLKPSVRQGDLVVVKEDISPQDIRVGDVISFLPPYGECPTGDLISHRVVSVEASGRVYVTQGDANDKPDSDTRDFDSVRGKVILSIPLLGSVLSFFTHSTIAVWIIIPIAFLAVIILLEVIKYAANKNRRKASKN